MERRSPCKRGGMAPVSRAPFQMFLVSSKTSDEVLLLTPLPQRSSVFTRAPWKPPRRDEFTWNLILPSFHTRARAEAGLAGALCTHRDSLL